MKFGLNLTTGLLLASAAAAFVVLVLFLHARTVWHERYRARVAGIQPGAGRVAPDMAARSNQSWPLNLVGQLGEMVSASGLLSKRTLEDLQQTLVVAGFRGRGALSLLIGSKLLLITVVPGAAWIMLRQTGHGSMQFYVPGALGIVGLMAPDFVIRQLRKKHLAALEKGLADALDLLVICTEAGLGLETGLERVGTEIRSVHPAVADEMTHTSQEMRVNADRRTALINMGKRTGLESLRRLGGTLVQSMQYGTPLSEALRVLSAELRQEALNRFENKAGRLSVLLTVPMIVFILPCVFLIAGGPAIVSVIHAFRH